MTNRVNRRLARQIDDGSVAVIFNQAGNEIAVARRPAAGARIDVRQYSADGQGPFIQNSQVRTTTFRWSAYTTPLDLVAATAGDTDENITRALLAAIRTEPDRLLPANTDLANTALDWARSAPSDLTITKADLGAVETAVDYTLAWLRAAAQSAVGHIPDDDAPWTVSVETPSRALVRFWLNYVADQSGDRYTTARGAVVAFLTVDHEGYAIALWSAATGLVHETEERLRMGVDAVHITDRVASLVTSASLREFNILDGELSAVVLCTDEPLPTLCDRLEARLPDVDITPVEELSQDDAPITYATALAIGALLDDARVPPIDLADSLPARLSRVEDEREWRRALETTAKVRQAVFFFFLPIVVALGVALAWHISTQRQAAALKAATQAATQEAARLATEARLRKSYEDQTRYYMALTDQILQLRERQPFMLRLLTDLNERWPRDPTLSLVSLRTNAGGGVEMKGKTRQQDTVTQLASSLEFGGGRFTDISPQSSAEIPGLAQGAPAGASATAPVISFVIKATYTPLAAALSAPKPPPPPMPNAAPTGGNAK